MISGSGENCFKLMTTYQKANVTDGHVNTPTTDKLISIQWYFARPTKNIDFYKRCKVCCHKLVYIALRISGLFFKCFRSFYRGSISSPLICNVYRKCITFNSLQRKSCKHKILIYIILSLIYVHTITKHIANNCCRIICKSVITDCSPSVIVENLQTS